MALVKPDVGRFAKIKVLGIGGGGGNALNTMISENQIQGVDFIAVNTDAQALLSTLAPTKLQIGENLTRGLGVGGDPDLGRQAAEESREKIAQLLVDTDMIFLTGGMGGGTCTGGAPIIAEIAREQNALTVAVVTKPFAFEGTRRMVIAEEGIENLEGKVDALIVIPNQKLLDSIDKKMTLLEAFRVADSVLGQGVQGISDIITLPGLINRDFADIKTIMKNAGSAFMGIGTGVGENRAQAAARGAISSPLLEISIDGAKGILFTITGGPDLTMNEVDEAAKIISEKADADANIIFGATIDEKLIDQIKITVIATGFDEARARLARFMAPTITPPPKEEVPPPVEEEKKEKPPEELSPPEAEIPPEELGEQFEIPAFLRQGR
ncbi:MAG: cell division protein FtsZ [Patescibacteria group bacterium]